MHREKDDFTDVFGSTHKHAKAVDTAAPTCGWGHAVLERLHKCHIVSVQLIIFGLSREPME